MMPYSLQVSNIMTHDHLNVNFTKFHKNIHKVTSTLTENTPIARDSMVLGSFRHEQQLGGVSTSQL